MMAFCEVCMFKTLIPDIKLKTVFQITPELLKSKNIKLLMLDLDNTLAPYRASIPSAELFISFKTASAGIVQNDLFASSIKLFPFEYFCRSSCTLQDLFSLFPPGLSFTLYTVLLRLIMISSFFCYRLVSLLMSSSIRISAFRLIS